eukprot:1737528-Alexandrium_andersonii.AAC.1
MHSARVRDRTCTLTQFESIIILRRRVTVPGITVATVRNRKFTLTQFEPILRQLVQFPASQLPRFMAHATHDCCRRSCL